MALSGGWRGNRARAACTGVDVFTTDMGAYWFRYERHTDFSMYSFGRDLKKDTLNPFENVPTPISQVNHEWLAAFPGETKSGELDPRPPRYTGSTKRPVRLWQGPERCYAAPGTRETHSEPTPRGVCELVLSPSHVSHFPSPPRGSYGAQRLLCS